MPVNPDGSLRPFNAAEIAAMQIATTDVREGRHPWETREIDQSILRRTYFVKWAERFNFCALCCGDSVVYNLSTLISRMLPDPRYGRHPQFPQMIATKITAIVGHARCLGEDADGMPEYAKARVEVQYDHVDFDLKTDALTASERERYVRFGGSEVDATSITVPGGSMHYFRDPALPDPGDRPTGVPVPYGYNIIRATEDFSLIWEQIPFDAFGAQSPAFLYRRIYGEPGFAPWIGMINTVTFENRPPGTVLFLGVSARTTRAHDAAKLQWRLEYKFNFAPEGQHKLLWLAQAGNGTTNGYYFVGARGVHRTPATLNDYESVVAGARPLGDLFKVG